MLNRFKTSHPCNTHPSDVSLYSIVLLVSLFFTIAFSYFKVFDQQEESFTRLYIMLYIRISLFTVIDGLHFCTNWEYHLNVLKISCMYCLARLLGKTNILYGIVPTALLLSLPFQGYLINNFRVCKIMGSNTNYFHYVQYCSSSSFLVLVLVKSVIWERWM